MSTPPPPTPAPPHSAPLDSTTLAHLHRTLSSFVAFVSQPQLTALLPLVAPLASTPLSPDAPLRLGGERQYHETVRDVEAMLAQIEAALRPGADVAYALQVAQRAELSLEAAREAVARKRLAAQSGGKQRRRSGGAVEAGGSSHGYEALLHSPPSHAAFAHFFGRFLDSLGSSRPSTAHDDAPQTPARSKTRREVHMRLVCLSSHMFSIHLVVARSLHALARFSYAPGPAHHQPWLPTLASLHLYASHQLASHPHNHHLLPPPSTFPLLRDVAAALLHRASRHPPPHNPNGWCLLAASLADIVDACDDLTH
ncbi:hypothetical protein ACQY0O_001487 [Thecaphora frezii]